MKRYPHCLATQQPLIVTIATLMAVVINPAALAQDMTVPADGIDAAERASAETDSTSGQASVLAFDGDALSLAPISVEALMVDAPLPETPRAVSVVTDAELQERAPRKLDEALRYSAGVTSQPYGSDNDTDWFRVRGFQAGTYLNGNRLFSNGYYTWQIEPFGLQQIEVVKGPAATHFGEVPPGGVVNAVTKKPLSQAQRSLHLGIGDRAHRSLGVDVSDSLDNGDTRYRLVGLVKDGDSELNGTGNRRLYLAPSLAMDLNQRTSLTLTASLLDDDGTPTNPFFPAAGTLIDTPNGDIDPETNLGEPDYDEYQRTQVNLGYELEYALNEHSALRQRLNYGYNELFLRSSYAFPNSDPAATELARGIVFRDGDSQSLSFDNRAEFDWQRGSVAHSALVGIDLQQHHTDGAEQDSFAFGTINPWNPVYGNFTPLSDADNLQQEITKRQASVHVQDRMAIDGQWIATFGARYDQVTTENSNSATGVDRSTDDSEPTVHGGLMYLADNGLSPYLNYSQSFDVRSGIDPATDDFYRPLKGEQIELGLKYQPERFDGSVNVALFDITQKNALVVNPDTFVATQTGEVTSAGLELEVKARLSNALSMTAAYAYVEAQTDNTGGQGRKQAGLIPEHTASVWLDYEALQHAGNRLGVSGGIRYIGESVDNPASSDLTVPDVLLLDAALSWQFHPQWRAQLNVSNLLDEEFVSGCDYYCYYGQSRSMVANLTWQW